MNEQIGLCTPEHLVRYGEIYASAFSGEPWNDPWTPENATVHVKELLGPKQAYGLHWDTSSHAI